MKELAQTIQEEKGNYEKRQRILQAFAAKNTKWHKYLHFSSGVIALISGGTVANLGMLILDPWSKIAGSTLALLSGIIALATTIFFDQTETQNSIKCAAQYDALCNRADSLYLRRADMPLDQLAQAVERMRTDESRLYSEHAQLIVNIENKKSA